MKSMCDVDRKPSTNLPSITLADKNNYKISLFTDSKKDTHRLSLDWSCNNSDIPSISINPQSEISQTTDNSKKRNKNFPVNSTSLLLPPPLKYQGDPPPFHSAPNSMACSSPAESQVLAPKEEASSESCDGIHGELNDFQQEHLDSPSTPDVINGGDFPVNDSSNSIFMNEELSSLKSRVTNIEMRVQSMYTMITEIHEWVRCQKGSILVEAMSAAPNTSNTAAETPISNNGELTNPYSPSSQPITLPSLAGPLAIPNFQSVSNLHSAYKPIANEYPSEFEVMELKRRSNTRRNFAAKLAMRIFGEEGLMMNNSSGKCPEGTIGKLDSTKMLLIKSLVFQHWPLLESEGISTEDFWKQECLRAIDEKGRYLRFQKKNVYKRMLWKKRTGVSGYLEQPQFVPTNIFPGNGELVNANQSQSQSSSATCPITTYSVTLENNP